MGVSQVNPFHCRDISTRIAVGGVEKDTWQVRWAVRFHLAYCWFCRKYERQLRAIATAFRAGSQQKLDSAGTTDFKQRLLDRLRK
jgi:hypothetical protein